MEKKHNPFTGYNGSKKITELNSLDIVAKTIGISMVLEGSLPKDINAANLILIAARECLTNSFRHAHATELYLKIVEATKSYTAIFSNNGIIPKAKIIEGGGLSNLRNKIEATGGIMEVSHIPKFALKVCIPKEGDE